MRVAQVVIAFFTLLVATSASTMGDDENKVRFNPALPQVEGGRGIDQNRDTAFEAAIRRMVSDQVECFMLKNGSKNVFENPNFKNMLENAIAKQVSATFEGVGFRNKLNTTVARQVNATIGRLPENATSASTMAIPPERALQPNDEDLEADKKFFSTLVEKHTRAVMLEQHFQVFVGNIMSEENFRPTLKTAVEASLSKELLQEAVVASLSKELLQEAVEASLSKELLEEAVAAHLGEKPRTQSKKIAAHIWQCMESNKTDMDMHFVFSCTTLALLTWSSQNLFVAFVYAVSLSLLLTGLLMAVDRVAYVLGWVYKRVVLLVKMISAD